MENNYTFFYSEDHRNSYKEGLLAKQWYAEYSFLFDDDDLRIAESQCKSGYHYFEWMTAILLYHQTGYCSLVEKYEFSNHQRKKEILLKTLGEELFDELKSARKQNNAQFPDLFLYDTNNGDWFFAEVKGSTDTHRKEQDKFFEDIMKVTYKEIVFVGFVKK